MRFGLFCGATARRNDHVTDSQLYTDFVDYVVEAEALGYYSVMLVEHHFTGMAQVSASLNLLSFLAAKTSRMRLGTAVVVLPWHNPILLAEQVGTLDLLSNGRFDFGIGRGYRPNEFKGFGIDPAEATERYQEAVEVLQKALGSKERFTHIGKRWRFEDIIVEPPCVQQPHPPIWVGAGSEPAIRAAAESGFRLLLDQLGTVEMIGERIAVYRNALEARGLSFDPYHVGVTRALHLAMNDKERREAHELRAKFLLGIMFLGAQAKGSSLALPASFEDVQRQTESTALIGTPDEMIARLKALEAVGVRYVLFMDVSGSREALRVFAREVMPAFPEPAEAAVQADPVSDQPAAPLQRAQR
jgi:alkanesulfonate monooxygenase SsuD/methylene tetrahydromethanopterin reductase-like flavin-dependent oxidoreductase (luciferase family)